MFLVGEGDSVLSHILNKSLAEQKQHKETKKLKEPWKKGPIKKTEKEKELAGRCWYTSSHSPQVTSL